MFELWCSTGIYNQLTLDLRSNDDLCDTFVLKTAASPCSTYCCSDDICYQSMLLKCSLALYRNAVTCRQAMLELCAPVI